MLVDANHLALTLNGQTILHDVSLHIDAGDIYGLLGPNGAGKSSTINLLLGLYRRDKGGLQLFGRSTNIVVSRRRIGMMPEFAGFYEWMNAGDYLVWYAGLYGGIQEPTNALLQRVGLAAVGNKPISQFSRGMRQRLALARALVHRPELLILDEPTNGLDPRGRQEIHDLLIALSSQHKVGILVCTHLLDDVERLCNRIGIISDGRTVVEDSLDDLLRGDEKPFYRLRITRAPASHQLPPGVRLVSTDAPWMTFEIDLPKQIDIGRVWEDLLVHGWSFDELHIDKSTLEERYLALTGATPAMDKEQEKAA